jgi:GT2 family glycosyltransferase
MKIATLPRVELTGSFAQPARQPEMIQDATSIVILTYNSMKTIGDCMKSVVTTMGPEDEIIVVDNGSVDGTIEFLKQIKGASPKIQVILNQANLGFSAGSNVGLKAGKGEFLVLLNPDTIVTTGWLHRMKRQFSHGRIGAVGPVIDTVAGHQKPELHVPEGLAGSFNYEGIARVLADANDGNGQTTKLLIGCCMMLRRQVLDEIGYLDNDLFLGCDDLDMSWRLMLANYRLVIARDAFVHHECHVSFDTEPKAAVEKLVQESWDKFARKLIAHYGMGQVPPPEKLWAIDWFGASPEVWDGASLPFDPLEMTRKKPLLPRTIGTFAAKIASVSGVTAIVEIGDEPSQLLPKVDAEYRMASVDQILASPESFANTVVICDELNLSFEQLDSLSRHAKAVLVSAPIDGADLPDGLPVMFSGETPTYRDRQDSRRRLWVLDRSKERLGEPVPEEFRPVALMTTFNDIDIIDAVIAHTLAQGMRLVVLDNWSTDGTYEKLLARRKLLDSLERFPPEGPSPTFDSYRILCRQEEIAAKYPGQWITIQASDELRVSPWKGVTMREGLYLAEQSGATCVDLSILDFRPVDNLYKSGCDPESTLKYCEFGKHESCLIQQKTWKQPVEKVQIAVSGGHAVFFEGKQVYPYKFLLKHYSIRSQTHGERKVFGMRQNRWNMEERQKFGWHTHYDDVKTGHNFLRDPKDLIRYEPNRFEYDYVVERLSGIGTIPGIDWWTPLHPDEWK